MDVRRFRDVKIPLSDGSHLYADVFRRAEDGEYFHDNADGLPWENPETVNTAVWVPNGYPVIRTDGPGSGKSPGTPAPWGIATAEAHKEPIEWAGQQPWSNGSVGLWGTSRSPTTAASSTRSSSRTGPTTAGARHAPRTTHHAYEPSCHTAATNSLHTGAERVGYVQLPLVPRQVRR
ncbi:MULTISPECIES: CocE/NonD family hydrolase [unclassified Streptomyces]|uniref:CocE/NonD family hydrolase n=1 Tax=unclassified Streptomyces TaxID=2593676 RepID=UPI00278BE5A1|nr:MULTISPECIES: CocE/NonD family hydrolase [unclassified Streptomyces]